MIPSLTMDGPTGIANGFAPTNRWMEGVDRPGTVGSQMPAREQLPALRTPGRDLVSRSGTTRGVLHSRSSMRDDLLRSDSFYEISKVYAPASRTLGSLTARTTGEPKAAVRMLEMRNQKLQQELQSALNLYGQSTNWVQQQKEQHAFREAEMSELWQRARAEQEQAQQEWLAELSHVRAEADRRLEAEAAELERLRQELNQRTSSEHDTSKRLETAERERKKQDLFNRMSRRLKHRGLARAWFAWAGVCFERRRMLGSLRTATNRIRKPVITAAYRTWHTQWQVAERRKMMNDTEKHTFDLKQQLSTAMAELEALRNELATRARAAFKEKSEALDLLRTELTGTLEEREAARKLRERDERVELLTRQVARRVMSKGLSAGWMAWIGFWEENTLRMRLLSQVTGTMTKPHIAHTFRFWRNDWLDTERSMLRESAQTVDAQLLNLRTLYQEAIAERDRLRESLGGVDLEGEDAQKLYEEKLQRELQERKEMVRRQFVRRMRNRDLTRGWETWFDMWEAETLRARQMQRVRNLMDRPALVTSFGFWIHDWRETQHRMERARLLRTSRKAQEEMMAEHDKVVRQLAAVQEEMARRLVAAEEHKQYALKQQEKELTGSLEEREAVRKQREREKRVELVIRQIARRMLNQDLRRGWTAWIESWEVQVERQRTLQGVANRLSRPREAMAFRHWHVDWQEALHFSERERLRAAGSKREMELLQERDALAAAFRVYKQDAESKLERLEWAHKQTLDRQLVQLTGSHEEREALRAQRDKEARVAQLTRQIARRILRQELIRGWTAWSEFWEAQASALRLMRRVESRLRRPALLMSYRSWFHDWQAAVVAKEAKLRHSLESELCELRYLHGALDLEKVAWVEERSSLKERIRLLQEDSKEVAHARNDALRQCHEVQTTLNEMMAAKDHAEWHGSGVAAAERARDEALAAMKAHKEGYQAELQRLLAEQRQTFEEELQVRLTASRDINERLEVERLKEEVQIVEKKANDMLAAQKSDWEVRLAAERTRAEGAEAEVVRLTQLSLNGKAAFGGVQNLLSIADAAVKESTAEQKKARNSVAGSGKGLLANFIIDVDSDVPVSEQVRRRS